MIHPCHMPAKSPVGISWLLHSGQPQQPIAAPPPPANAPTRSSAPRLARVATSKRFSPAVMASGSAAKDRILLRAASPMTMIVAKKVSASAR